MMMIMMTIIMVLYELKGLEIAVIFIVSFIVNLIYFGFIIIEIFIVFKRNVVELRLGLRLGLDLDLDRFSGSKSGPISGRVKDCRSKLGVSP